MTDSAAAMTVQVIIKLLAVLQLLTCLCVHTFGQSRFLVPTLVRRVVILFPTVATRGLL